LSDERLVEECLSGGEEAWRALVDKYKNLVYNIILKYGAGSEEAADLFQTVWLEAYNDLPKLRKKSAVKAWLVSLTTHQCYHWKQKQKRRDFFESGEFSAEDLEEMIPLDPSFVEDLERDQLVREAIYRLSPRCQEMIRLLFFTSPPVPYKEVARRLGLATGSIGFIRGRCLQRLQKNLDQEGI
jgi:RNA polymerase sigma factor (sigma-70 family)